MSTLEFDKLLSAMKITSTVLLDVRNESELADDGRIPGSVNIPLPELSAAFQMSPEMFSEKYSFSLPDKDSESLILTCRSGKRAFMAKGQLEELGFKNVKVYEGSFLDWKAKGGDIE